MGRFSMLFPPLSELRRDIDRIFSRSLQPAVDLDAAQGYPAVNIWDEGETTYLEAELPGVPPAGIDVRVAGASITISGQRERAQLKDVSFIRRECPGGTFSRTIELPWEIDSQKVQASFKEGVLLLSLPKVEAAKPRKVSVAST